MDKGVLFAELVKNDKLEDATTLAIELVNEDAFSVVHPRSLQSYFQKLGENGKTDVLQQISDLLPEVRKNFQLFFITKII